MDVTPITSHVNLISPPKAPRRRRQRVPIAPPEYRPFVMKREVPPLWQILRSRVKKWGRYTPEDVNEIQCGKTLKLLYEKYTFPSSQPQNPDEWKYCMLMSECLLERLKSLNLV